MCLAIPMKVSKIEGNMGMVSLSGTQRKINIEFTDGIKVGDYVVVHAGFAIQKLDEKQAKKTLSLLSEIPKR
ncbi:MAG: HypC/HybG/HupF family hydrogenase formation chaperone [Candidatus Omnitrophica bacterium]|nr:HypC/HybG/HupF family hydrogenase formation chaperone [Candidatus Omnitrophota bacterium]